MRHLEPTQLTPLTTVLNLLKHLHQFYLEPGTNVSMSRDVQNMGKLVVPYKLHARYLYQAHDCTNHSGVTRMHEHVSS